MHGDDGSMGSYMGLARLIPGRKNPNMERVFKADILATAALCVGWFFDNGGVAEG